MTIKIILNDFDCIGSDSYDPQITIKTVAVITIRFCVDPKDKLQVKNMIQTAQEKCFKQ